MKFLKFILTTFVTLSAVNATQAFANTEVSQQKNVASECLQLFKQAETLVAEAEKQPGTHTNLAQIKTKLNKSKQEILELDASNQAKSCVIGLAKLNKVTTTANNNHNNHSNVL